MNRALRFTLLGLAVVVVMFAVTWFSIPSGPFEDVSPPASLFLPGVGSRCATGARSLPVRVRPPNDERPGACASGVVLDQSDLDALKMRIVVFYGSVAVVIVLVGLAFGAGRRSPSEA